MTQPYQLRLRPLPDDGPIEHRVAELIATARQRFGFNTNEVVLVLEPMIGDVPAVIRLRRLLKVAKRRQALRCTEASDSPDSILQRPPARSNTPKRASVAGNATEKQVA